MSLSNLKGQRRETFVIPFKVDRTSLLLFQAKNKTLTNLQACLACPCKENPVIFCNQYLSKTWEGV